MVRTSWAGTFPQTLLVLVGLHTQTVTHFYQIPWVALLVNAKTHPNQWCPNQNLTTPTDQKHMYSTAPLCCHSFPGVRCLGPEPGSKRPKRHVEGGQFFGGAPTIFDITSLCSLGSGSVRKHSFETGTAMSLQDLPAYAGNAFPPTSSAQNPPNMRSA